MTGYETDSELWEQACQSSACPGIPASAIYADLLWERECARTKAMNEPSEEEYDWDTYLHGNSLEVL